MKTGTAEVSQLATKSPLSGSHWERVPLGHVLVAHVLALCIGTGCHYYMASHV